MFTRTLPVLLALLVATQVFAGQPALADARANPHPTPTPVPTVPMGVSHIVGFEMGGNGSIGTSNMAASEGFLSTHSSAGVVVEVQPTVVRSGTQAFHVLEGTGDYGYVEFRQRAAGGTFRSGYHSFRGYLRVGALPSVQQIIAGLFTTAGATTGWHVDLLANGTLAITLTGSSATSSLALSADGNFHRIEVDMASAATTVYVDGTQWVTIAGSAVAAAQAARLGIGCDNTIATAGEIYWDDVVWYDASTGGALGSDYSVGILLPVSDNTVSPAASWTGGAGGTTNLFAAVDQVPPHGRAASWLDTTEIKSGSATNPAFYVANMAAYNTLQPNAATIGTILAVQAEVNHAEEVATGTKNGDVWISANPAQSQPTSTGFGSFNYGDDSGVITAFAAVASDWRTAVGPVTASPSVTLTTQPTVRLDKIDATTRVAHADFLGLYVMYTLVQPPELTGTPYGLRGQAQMRQLLAQ